MKFISHLDIIRLWQRALHRAGIPPAYSEGFSPHPRISLAAPLSVGTTSQAELMDVVLAKWASPHFFTSAVSQQLPASLAIQQVFQIAPTLPSLQSQVRYAEYRVEVATDRAPSEIATALAALLAREELPWQHQRDTGPRHYDLRALIDDLWLTDPAPPYAVLGMRLRCDNSGSGRPEQVTAALGFTAPPQSIHRTKLILETG